LSFAWGKPLPPHLFKIARQRPFLGLAALLEETPLPTAKTCHGLPWLNKHEKKLFDKQGYACIYAAGIVAGRPLYIGRTGKLPERMTDLKSECKGDFAIHYVTWTKGDPLARRIMVQAETILDRTKRRLRSNLFDVTPDLARKVILVAADKAGVRIFTQGQMLEKIRVMRQAQTDAVLREYVTEEKCDWGGFKAGVQVDEGRGDLDMPIHKKQN
jgi:hypothetical protein